MKTLRIILCLISALALGPGSSQAQEAGPDGRGMHPQGDEFQRPLGGGNSGGKDKASREASMLGHLLELNNEQLSQLRETVERIEKMTPEERTALRKRLKKMHRMDPNKVDEMRKRFEEIPVEQRNEMRQRWLDMSPTERKEWRDKLRKMPHEERQAIIEEQGFLPPQHFKRKGPKSPRDGNIKGPRKRGPEGGPPPPPTPPAEEEIAVE